MTLQEYLKDIREEFPVLVGLSDEETYLWGKQNRPEIEVESWDRAEEFSKEKEVEAPPNTSPSAFKKLLTYGIDEDSPWIMRNAYANSLSGVAVDWMNGSSKFTPEELQDYDPSVLEEAASGVMSFLFPLDMLTLFTGGLGLASKVGGKVVAGGVKKGMLTSQINKLARKGSVASARRGLHKYANKDVMEATLMRMVKDGVTMAEYEGIKSNLAAQLNGENVLSETFHGIVHGGAMGAAFGLTGGYLGGGLSNGCSVLFIHLGDN